LYARNDGSVGAVHW